jgi:hypothetical protein
MFNSRRHLLQSFVVVSGALAAAPLLLSQGVPSSPPYKASPNAPNPNFPQGMNGPAPTVPSEKAIYKQNQALMKQDIEKMYALVSELRQDVQLTDTTAVFNVGFVKRAKEVEQLAKRVKDLAKG